MGPVVHHLTFGLHHLLVQRLTRHKAAASAAILTPVPFPRENENFPMASPHGFAKSHETS